MVFRNILCLLLCLPIFASSHGLRAPSPHFHWRRSNVPPEGYFNPLDNGGSFLTKVVNTYPEGLGEPLNAIISASSDPDILVDQETNGGLRNYFLSFGFSSECLGQHLGDDQAANLGDGHGYKNETAVIRWNYGDPQLGSCKESIEGGNHFRFWVQDGDQGNSGSIFMAVSYELPMKLHHDIIYNGYNLGRDWLVGNVTNQTSVIPTSELTNTSTFSGRTTWANYTYETNVQYTPSLLSNSSDGINHYLSVGGNGINAIDGLVAVMTVKIVERPQSSSGVLTALSAPSLWLYLALVASIYSLSL